ncbi:MAG TPA: hypothetical protein VGQ59_05785 [Cyclobacteriaceae bacterium]|jgi:hypothetical protein|nr:hypothetical protein [Cyclobacteriaceae bacterium]
MLKSDRKKYVFQEFDKALLNFGFEGIKTGSDPTYIMKSNEIVVSFFMNFKDLGSVSMSSIRISINVIEDIIINVLGEDFVKANYFFDRKKYFLTTVVDENFKDIYQYRELNSESDLRELTNWYINYIKVEAKEFVDTYRYLPNILKKMNELRAEGKFWSDILGGTVDHLFRGLIISKLCSDKGFEDKVVFVENVFKENDLSKWQPYFVDLKERLKTV